MRLLSRLSSSNFLPPADLLKLNSSRPLSNMIVFQASKLNANKFISVVVDGGQSDMLKVAPAGRLGPSIGGWRDSLLHHTPAAFLFSSNMPSPPTESNTFSSSRASSKHVFAFTSSSLFSGPCFSRYASLQQTPKQQSRKKMELQTTYSFQQ